MLDDILNMNERNWYKRAQVMKALINSNIVFDKDIPKANHF
jgi:hypothetical protein